MNFLEIPLEFTLLIPAIIGLTAAVKSEFPSLEKHGAIVSLVVTVAIYYAYIILPTNLFGLLYAVGSAMGIYTGAKKIGGA